MPDFAAKYVDEFDENGIEHEGNENMLQLMQMNITREEVRIAIVKQDFVRMTWSSRVY